MTYITPGKTEGINKYIHSSQSASYVVFITI